MNTYELRIENIGWTLGNDCPYRCPHCYSHIVRNKGRNLETHDVDRIVGQLKQIGVKTVNLGGNEPIYTSGPDPRKTILPYIIRSLHDAGIAVGLTTAGITLLYLERLFPDSVVLLNDIDISLDSPFPQEHNKNRQAPLYNLALEAIHICKKYGIERTIIMCGMRWNLTTGHLEALVTLARKHDALIRINFMKPTEPQHMELVPNATQFYESCSFLLSKCKGVEIGEPLAATMSMARSKGCPCGTKSFRIHSIDPSGRVPVSPCVYAHEYKTGNLLTDDLSDIIASPKFESFRQRRRNPTSITACTGCEHLMSCGGGCTSRSYLWSQFSGGTTSLSDVKDPYCLRDNNVVTACPVPTMSRQDLTLVHRDYLCTLIVDPS